MRRYNIREVASAIIEFSSQWNGYSSADEYGLLFDCMSEFFFPEYERVPVKNEPITVEYVRLLRSEPTPVVKDDYYYTFHGGIDAITCDTIMGDAIVKLTTEKRLLFSVPRYQELYIFVTDNFMHIDKMLKSDKEKNAIRFMVDGIMKCSLPWELATRRIEEPKVRADSLRRVKELTDGITKMIRELKGVLAQYGKTFYVTPSLRESVEEFVSTHCGSYTVEEDISVYFAETVIVTDHDGILKTTTIPHLKVTDEIEKLFEQDRRSKKIRKLTGR